MTDLDKFLANELARIREEGLERSRRRVKPLADGWCEVAGRLQGGLTRRRRPTPGLPSNAHPAAAGTLRHSGGRRLRDFASNDYLNLAHDPRVVEAARAAAKTAGIGSRASALVTGRTDWHVALEDRLARFERQQTAILFPSGYAANLGVISALANREDAVFSDRLNHASLIDGCRLSRAEIHIYDRRQLDRLERDLQEAGDRRRRWIVTNSVFSMDGDVAPLRELCDLAEKHAADLIVDEAHATGVLGAHGRGAKEWLDVEDRVAVAVGTLSKGVGCLGGFVAGSETLIGWLWNRARTQIYSTALPPAVCAAACTAIDIIENEPQRRERLIELAGRLRRGIREHGLATTDGGVGSIVPVVLNDPWSAVSVAERLEQRGFLVAAIRPPTVPPGTSRLRLSLNCAHDEDAIDELVRVLCDVVQPVA